jgi:hypothetical protein
VTVVHKPKSCKESVHDEEEYLKGKNQLKNRQQYFLYNNNQLDDNTLIRYFLTEVLPSFLNDNWCFLKHEEPSDDQTSDHHNHPTNSKCGKCCIFCEVK